MRKLFFVLVCISSFAYGQTSPAGVWYNEISQKLLFSQSATDNSGGVIGVEDSAKIGWDGSIWRIILTRNDTAMYLKGLPGSGGILGVSSTGGVFRTSGSGLTDLSFTGASSPVTLNSSTGTDVTITAGTGISLTGTGTDLTINNTGIITEVDGSTTNEVQDLSYDNTNHEIDISLGGTSAIIPLATTSQIGLLTDTDWDIFNTVVQPTYRIAIGNGASGLTSDAKLYYSGSTLFNYGSASDNVSMGGNTLIVTTSGVDEKAIQVKNNISALGIITAFADEYQNGGFSVDSANGSTIVKLRGSRSNHSYLTNRYVSVGRAGSSVSHGGLISGAQFTIENNIEHRDAGDDLSNPENYMMIISDDNTVNRELGLGFTVSSASETNVGAAFIFESTGVNSKGKLRGYTKTSTTDTDDPALVFTMDDDGSFDVSNELNVGNDFAINTDGKISEYGNSTPALGEVLVGDGTSFKKRFVPWMMSPQEGWFAYSEMNGRTANNKGAMDMWVMSAPSNNYSVTSSYSGGISGAVFAGTQTSATGTAMLYSDKQGINLADGVMVFETSLRLLDSATTAENYNLFFGLASDQNDPDNAAQKQILFRYSRASVPSRKWEIIVGDGSAQTVYNTGVQWDEDVTYILRVESDRQTAGEVKFYIDGTLVYTATANISDSAMGFFEGIIKTAGTTSRTFHTDYLWAWQRWYTPQTSRGLFESIAGY